MESRKRIQSLDLLRGLVMILMAIDHVRVYSGIPASSPDTAIFLTRWITHFCAPAFAFFAGTSSFLYEQKVSDKGKVARFLLTRGLILVFLEVTVIRFFWAFNIEFSEFILAGVIWMLGWCLVLLAGLIWLKPKVVGILGILIIVFQQVFAKVPLILPESAQASFVKFWEFFYASGFETYPGVYVLYSIIPWIGVMAVGYWFGTIYQMEERKMKAWCYAIGFSAIALYLILGTTKILSSDSTSDLPFILELLNQQKYPASQLFLLMTLGPTIALIPIADKVTGWISKAVIIIGRVPFFYYLLHIILIHISALVVQLFLNGGINHEVYYYAPFVSIPPESRWSLSLLYLVFAIDVAILYLICKQYAAFKRNHPEKKWLSYL